MSNNCFTSYTVTGSHKDIERLHAVITAICKITEKEKAGLGKCWFEHIAEYLSLDNSDGRYDLRGTVFRIEKAYDSISFHTASAWTPNHAIVNALTSSVSEGFNILYSSEEFNNGVFLTNDPTIAGKWVYVFGSDIEDYPEPLREVLESPDLLDSRDLGDALVKSLGHDGNLRHLAAEACRKFCLDLFQYEFEPIV